jgi:diacylglycerol O-acyltransferase 1
MTTEAPNMATLVDTATTTGTQIPTGAASRKSHRSNGQQLLTHAKKPEKNLNRKFNHVFAIHRRPKASPLGKDADTTPSFFGFKTLMALTESPVVSNLRLMIENFRKV